MNRSDADVLVVGGGAAGMLAALKAADLGFRTILAHAGRLAESSTSWIAGADFTVVDVGAGDNITKLGRDIACEGMLVNSYGHVQDYCVRCGEVESDLLRLGLRFRRVVCEHGSELRRAGFLFGWEWCQRLAAKVLGHPCITVLPCMRLLQLLGGSESCGGAVFKGHNRSLLAVTAPYTVLATGGWAGLFRHRTASPFARGEGIGAAARLGARIADMEFVQFVPFVPVSQGTAKWRMNLHFLVTVLGAGELRREDGSSPLIELGVRDRERAPKEVISLALGLDRLHRHNVQYKVVASRRAFLEAEAIHHEISNMLKRLQPKKWNRRNLVFPLFELLRESSGIPVDLAAHFTTGGVVVSKDMATTVPGLFAIGECRSGLWGAGRVYSACTQCHSDVMGLEFAGAGARLPDSVVSEQVRSIEKTTSLSSSQVAASHAVVRAATQNSLGPIRTGESLRGAEVTARTLLETSDPVVRNQAVVLLMAIAAALAREETRGCHIRTERLECSAETVSHHLSFRDPDNQLHLERVTTAGVFRRSMNIEEQINMLQEPTTRSSLCYIDDPVDTAVAGCEGGES